MKINRKGFTLIELLAVIVVLGIILAIAIPKVVDTIENSKKGSFESSVKAYYKAAQQYVTKQEVNGTPVLEGEPQNIQNLDMQNKTGWTGYWTLNDGKVQIIQITHDKYTTSVNENGNIGGTITLYELKNGSDDIVINGTTLFVNAYEYDGPKAIVIPEGITEISGFQLDYGVEGGLTSISLPSTLTTIGIMAFKNNDLTSVILPPSVINVKERAFQYSSINSVILSERLTTIEYAAFEECNLTSIVIPSNVETIGMGAFSGNSNLTIVKNKTGKSFSWPSIVERLEGPDDPGATCTMTSGTSNASFITGSCIVNPGTAQERTVTITD